MQWHDLNGQSFLPFQNNYNNYIKTEAANIPNNSCIIRCIMDGKQPSISMVILEKSIVANRFIIDHSKKIIKGIETRIMSLEVNAYNEIIYQDYSKFVSNDSSTFTFKWVNADAPYIDTLKLISENWIKI